MHEVTEYPEHLNLNRLRSILYFRTDLYVVLKGTNYTTNNSVVLLDEIGDRNGALHCRTSLTGCCETKGEWIYPNETQVPINSTGYGFYRTRGTTRVTLRKRTETLSPTGIYCCKVPTSGSNKTFCVFLSEL